MNSDSLTKDLSLPAAGKKFWHILRDVFWDAGIRRGQHPLGAYLFLALAMAAFMAEMLVHHNGRSILGTLHASTISVFYNVPPVEVAQTGNHIFTQFLLLAAALRILFTVVVGALDIVLHQKIKGEAFDWEGMVTISMVNAIYLLTAVFTLTNPMVDALLARYAQFVAELPVLVSLNGPLALICAACWRISAITGRIAGATRSGSFGAWAMSATTARRT